MLTVDGSARGDAALCGSEVCWFWSLLFAEATSSPFCKRLDAFPFDNRCVLASRCCCVNYWAASCYSTDFICFHLSLRGFWLAEKSAEESELYFIWIVFQTAANIVAASFPYHSRPWSDRTARIITSPRAAIRIECEWVASTLPFQLIDGNSSVTISFELFSKIFVSFQPASSNKPFVLFRFQTIFGSSTQFSVLM